MVPPDPLADDVFLTGSPHRAANWRIRLGPGLPIRQISSHDRTQTNRSIQANTAFYLVIHDLGDVRGPVALRSETTSHLVSHPCGQNQRADGR